MSGSGYAGLEGVLDGRSCAVTASVAEVSRPYLVSQPIVVPRRVLVSVPNKVHPHHDGDGDGQDCYENLRQHATHIRSVAGITHTMPRIR